MAVGETLRRLVERVAMSLGPTKQVMKDMLPTQTGLAGNGMCEQLAFSLQVVLENNPYGGRWIVLQVDITNGSTL